MDNKELYKYKCKPKTTMKRTNIEKTKIKRGKCVKNKIKSEETEVKRGEGILNTIIDYLPMELHMPGGYQYCGPGDYKTRFNDINFFNKSSFIINRY